MNMTQPTMAIKSEVYSNGLVIYSEGGNEPWLECTDADKRKREVDHPQPKPEQ